MLTSRRGLSTPPCFEPLDKDGSSAAVVAVTQAPGVEDLEERDRVRGRSEGKVELGAGFLRE